MDLGGGGQRLFPYTALTDWFLSVFAKPRKATISFVMSIRPSVQMELVSHWTEIHEISYLEYFSKVSWEN